MSGALGTAGEDAGALKDQQGGQRPRAESTGVSGTRLGERVVGASQAVGPRQPEHRGARRGREEHAPIIQTRKLRLREVK